MNNFTNQRREYQDLGQLLNLLEDQLICFEAGDEPNYALMVDILDYIEHHPDQGVSRRRGHHCVVSGAPPSPADSGFLRNEWHLANVSRHFADMLKSVYAGQLVKRSHFSATARDYIRSTRQWMERVQDEGSPARRLTERRRHHGGGRAAAGSSSTPDRHEKHFSTPVRPEPSPDDSLYLRITLNSRSR